jgi:hypothetical protein
VLKAGERVAAARFAGAGCDGQSRQDFTILGAMLRADDEGTRGPNT